MIIGLQIIALIFAFTMIYIAVLHFKRKEISRIETYLWLVMWTIAIVVIVFPELLRSFASTFLVTRVFDLMVIAGFILVITMVGSAYIKTKRMEKKLEDIIRRDAMNKVKRKK